MVLARLASIQSFRFGISAKASNAACQPFQRTADLLLLILGSIPVTQLVLQLNSDQRPPLRRQPQISQASRLVDLPPHLSTCKLLLKDSLPPSVPVTVPRSLGLLALPTVQLPPPPVLPPPLLRRHQPPSRLPGALLPRRQDSLRVDSPTLASPTSSPMVRSQRQPPLVSRR